MQSEEKIREKLRVCNEAIKFVKEKKDSPDSVELIAQEMQVLDWMLVGPKRHTLREIHRVLENYASKDDRGIINVMGIMAALARDLER